ncbi:MAG: Omp28-related outer membrane protein [FCB group bacterium]
MKKLILVFLLMFIASQAFSQSYYRIKKVGTEKDYNINTSGTVVIPSTANGYLSDPIALPFTWKFFGEDVTQFKASDNGFITFDVNQAINDTGNVELPSVNAPKNAIFALWDDLEFKPIPSHPEFETDAKYFIYGTAPKRVFVIQWINASLIDYTTNLTKMSFAIRLYEGGDFDLVYNCGTPITSKMVNATIGAQNADGTQGMEVPGSPYLPFPNPLGIQSNATDSIYVFKYGVQKSYDVEMSSLQAPAIASKGTSVTFSSNLTNWGTEDLTSFTLNYSVDNGTPVSFNITDDTIQGSGGSTLINFPGSWKPLQSGKFVKIKAWASNLNGHPDENNVNDTTVTLVFVNNGTTVPTKVLIEEGSGCWCGYCPDGHVQMRKILANYKNVVGIVHHSSNGNAIDSMETKDCDIPINYAYQTIGYPYAMVNRTLFNGEPYVCIDRTNNNWQTKVTEALNINTPASVTIDRTYDPVTRKIDFTVNVKFADYALGDMRINAFIIEDNVRGLDYTGILRLAWTQHNYYSSELGSSGVNDSTNELFYTPEYFVGYLHRHVVRATLTGAWGDIGIIPSIANPDQTYSKSYSYTLPPEVQVSYDTPGINTIYQSTDPGVGRNKAQDTKIVAFVLNYSDDPTQNRVLNVAEMPFGEVGVNENTNTPTNSTATIYPNPAYGISTIEFTTPVLTHASVDIYNALGQKIQAIKEANFIQGTHYIAFNADALQNGTYFVNIKTDTGTITQSFVVVR